MLVIVISFELRLKHFNVCSSTGPDTSNKSTFVYFLFVILQRKMVRWKNFVQLSLAASIGGACDRQNWRRWPCVTCPGFGASAVPFGGHEQYGIFCPRPKVHAQGGVAKPGCRSRGAAMPQPLGGLSCAAGGLPPATPRVGTGCWGAVRAAGRRATARAPTRHPLPTLC